MTPMQKSLFGKLWKGFISGGLAMAGAELAASPLEISSLADFQTVLSIVVGGFISGGVLAVMKWWTWKS